jgi:16S rRNA (guanine527-N7)-methyltransferase
VDAARIAQLLAPFLNGAQLTDEQLNDISTYIDLLLQWNTRINLTSIRNREEIVTRHFGESLFAARHLFSLRNCHPERGIHQTKPTTSHVGTAAPGCPAERVPHPTRFSLGGDVDLLDLGSGAGFPGLPIKIWAPHLKVTLIESNQKKATFLREVCRASTLTDVNVLAARAQAYTGPPASTVTLRAVERFDSVLPIARRVLAPGGRMALLIGTSQLDRAHHTCIDLAWSAPLPIPLSTSRILLLGTTSPVANL